MPTRTTSRRRPSLTEDIMPFSEYRGKLAACFDRVNETLRQLIVRPYRVIYEVSGECCNILGVMRACRLIGLRNLGTDESRFD